MTSQRIEQVWINPSGYVAWRIYELRPLWLFKIYAYERITPIQSSVELYNGTTEAFVDVDYVKDNDREMKHDI